MRALPAAGLTWGVKGAPLRVRGQRCQAACAQAHWLLHRRTRQPLRLDPCRQRMLCRDRRNTPGPPSEHTRTHTTRAWDTWTSVPRERQVTLQTCEAAQAGNVASGAKGVWLMCRCTEHTQMLTSNKGSRRIKNIHTKSSELRFRSSSIKSL